MDPQEFEELIKGLLDAETTKDANDKLKEFLSDQQSVTFLLQMIESSESEQIKTFSIKFLRMYMDKNFDSLEHELQGQLLDKIIELTFSEEYKYSDLLYPIFCDYVDQEKSLALLPMIDSCFSENQNSVIAMKILSEIITNFEDEQGISTIKENQEKFLNYSLEGLQSSNWELIIPSMLVFFYTKFVNPDIPNDPFIDIIIQHGEEPDLYKDDNSFGKYWPIIYDSISKGIISSDKLGEIYKYIIEFSSNEEIPYSSRIIPLQSLVGAVKLLDAEQYSAVLNLVFTISMKCVDQDETIPIDYFDLISKALIDLPMKDIYMMLKERITSLLSQDDRASHVISIVIYSIVFDIAPDAAFSDIDSIIENLFSALEKNDELLNTAVCIVLKSFQDSFRSVDVFAIHFLPKIVPFIISPNNELRQEAKNALHTICNLITIPIQGFLEALWQIKDQIPNDEFDDYLTYLATAIEKSEEIGDQETESLKEFILPKLNDLEDPNTASNYLSIFVTLVTTNETLIEQLLPPAANVINTCLTSAEINESSITNCLYCITNFYETYGAKYNEIFTDIIKLVLGILFSEDEEEEINDTGDSIAIKSAALEASCTYAESTEDNELAVKLQEKCVDFFTRNYQQEVDENSDDEDADSIEDIEYNAIKLGSNSSCLIAKLLNQEDARTLFQNIYQYIIETEYPECASEALKPFTKLVHISGEEDKEFYLKYSNLFLNEVIHGSLKAFHEKNIFNDQIDLFLMTNIAYLIAECVRYTSPMVDELCSFMIQIIKSSLDSAYLYSFIGAYSDVIKYNTGSSESIQAILELVPQLLENAKDPDTKLNLAYLLSLFVQKDPQSIQNVQEFVPILQNWYQKGIESPNGHQLMLSNIASAFLTFMANGMEVNLTLLKEAVSEFPPCDEKETAPMIQNMATIFSANQIDLECIETAARALSKFFVLKDTDLKKRKVPSDLMETANQMFITFSKSNPEIIQQILESYQNTKTKLEKLTQILEE